MLHRPAAVAAGRLSFRYGHFPWLFSQSGAMDRTFGRVVVGDARGGVAEAEPSQS